MDCVTVKTELLYCSFSYLFIAFVGFIAFIVVLVQTTCFGPSLGPSSGLARV
jgi:nitrate reductase NapE component